MLKREFQVSGMTCAACQARVTRAVSVLLGVSDVDVNLLTGKMTVVFDETKIDEKAIEDAVSKAGYHAEVSSDDNYDEYSAKWKKLKQMQRKDIQTMKVRLIVSISILLPLLYISMGSMMGLPTFWFFDGMQNAVWLALVQLIFTSIIIVVNRKFFISGFKALVSLSPNMDSLVAIGASAAYIYGIVVTIMLAASKVNMNMELTHKLMHNLYFESAATILTLVTLGKFFETLSKNKTTSALENLVKMSPKTATILKDGKEIVVPAKNIQKGDIVVIKTGDIVAVDGKIVQGEGLVNQASITGESVPVKKVNGDAVISASICENGSFQMVATKVGKETTFAQIIELVDEASSSKAPISKVADRVSGVFVPIVIGLAIITFLIWIIISKNVGTSLSNAISVLVISCPCALGLATPVAIMVGNGMGAKNGMMFKTASSLEETGKIDIVALDKTGTITSGEPKVTDIICADGFGKNDLLENAYSIEMLSEHPLAKAVTGYVKDNKSDIFNKKYNITEFQALAGNGLSGINGEDKITGGSLKFMSNTVNVPKEMDKKAQELAEQGKTPLLFAKNDKLLGIIAVADVIKEESGQAVKELHDMGVRVVMLTGDNERTAKAIGRQAGFDEVIAGVLPDGKEAVIRKLKESGKVAMVGDGINDAPALTRADIGSAIGAGTDIAIDAADIVLMKSRLTDVPAAIRLSRATLRNIHENLFWAFFYNIIGIPLAAGVWIPLFGWTLNPMFGAAAMSLSSFCVVTNALRLNLFKVYDASHDRKRVKKHDNNKNSKGEKNMEKTLNIEGMMCGHCEARVKKALEALAQVDEAVVSHESGTAVVKLNVDVDDAVLKEAVEAQDYKVTGIN